MKKIILYFLILGIFLPNLAFASSSLFSQDRQKSSQKIGAPEGAGIVLGVKDIKLAKPLYMPQSTAYAFQQVKEKIRALFIFDKQKKISYLLENAELRLSETKQSIKNKNDNKAKISLDKAASLYKSIYDILKDENKKLLDKDELETVTNHLTILTTFEQGSAIASKDFENSLKYLLLIQSENDKL